MAKFTSKGMKALLVCVFFQIAATFLIGSVTAIAPEMIKSFKVHDSVTGIFLGLCYFGTFLMSFFAGVLLRRYGPIRANQLSCFLGAAALALCTIPNLWIVAVGAVILGSSYGAVIPAASDIITRCVSRDNWDIVLSVKEASSPFGTAIAGFILPSAAILWGWQIALLGCSVFGLAVILVAQFFHRAYDDHDEKDVETSLSSFAGPLRLVLKSPPLWRLALVSFLYEGFEICLSGFLVVAMTRSSAGFGLVFAGLMLSLINIGAFVGRISLGFISQKTGNPKTILSMLGPVVFATATAMAAATSQWNHFLIFAICFVCGFAALGWKGIFLSLLAKCAPEGKAGFATAGVDIFSFLGAIVMPPAFGLVAYLSGSYLVSYGSISALCGIAGIWLFFQRIENKPAP